MLYMTLSGCYTRIHARGKEEIKMKIQVSTAIILLVFNLLATLSDLKSFRISNTLILTGAITGLSLSLLLSGSRGLAAALLGLTPPLLLLPLFMFSMIGAADIKLLMVTGIFLGPVLCLQSMALTGIFAGGWALVRMLRGQLFKERFDYLRRYLAGLYFLRSRNLSVSRAVPAYIDPDQMAAKKRWMIPLALPMCLADLVICLGQLMAATD